MTKRVPRTSAGRVTTHGVGGFPVAPTYTVATVPAATGRAGQMVYLSNGAAGSVMLCFSDGTNWKRCDTGATAAAS